MKIIDRGPYLVGFPAMQIMNLWGMFFHPANVSSLTFTLEVKSCSALCESLQQITQVVTLILSTFLLPFYKEGVCLFMLEMRPLSIDYFYQIQVLHCFCDLALLFVPTNNKVMDRQRCLNMY